jgi:hypothetical protein
MTLAKVAEIAGCGEKTVRREAKKLWPTRIYTGGAALSDADALELVSRLPKRNMVSGQKTGQMTAIEISSIVAETIKQIIPFLISIPKKEEVKQIAPPLVTRDELRRIVNKAANESGDYSGTWNRLYQEVYYRLHINAKQRAENSGAMALDIIEDQGLLADTIAIAREIF